MDPDETLSALRVWADSVATDAMPVSADTVRAAELFQALDEWLSGCGFPPAGWVRGW